LASTTSPEASEIRRRGRRRLIGAIALVMLLVVFVPMFLDPEPKPARGPEPVLAIPPKDNAPPLPPPSIAPAPAVVPAPAVAPAQTAAQSTAAAGTTGPAAAVAPTPAGAQSPKVESATLSPKIESKPADSPKLEGFVVQVGAFRDESKLAQAREKLAAAGVVHYTERLESKGGALTRLRAGPFPTREAAEAALAKLKRGSLDGKVVPLAAEREERKR
jgi:DedD protein